MSAEEFEKLKAQRPNYSEKIGETDKGDTVTFIAAQEYFIDSLIDYIDSLETRLKNIETRLTNGGL